MYRILKQTQHIKLVRYKYTKNKFDVPKHKWLINKTTNNPLLFNYDNINTKSKIEVLNKMSYDKIIK